MKIEIIGNGKSPTRAHEDDAGLDCYARESITIEPQCTMRIPLGFAVQLPKPNWISRILFGIYKMKISGRSSVSSKSILCHDGTIDAGYRNEVAAILTNISDKPFYITAGDRVAQATVSRVLTPKLKQVDALDGSKRGLGGFGSTGK